MSLPRRFLSFLAILMLLGLVAVQCQVVAPPPAQTTAVTEAPATSEAPPATEAPAAPATPETTGEVAATPMPAADLKLETPKPSKEYTIALVIGIVGDPFYVSMEKAAKAEAEKLGVNLIVDGPQEYNPVLQTPIIDAMIARGDVDFLLAVPTDTEAMVAPLKRAHDAGLPIITLDTYIGQNTYGGNGPADFPLGYIGSDNFEGGMVSCQQLADLMKGQGKVYIQNVVPGDSSLDGRELGCKAVLAKNPGMELVGVEYNDDDPNKAQAQTGAVLQRETDLGGIFGTNVYAAEGAGKAVKNAGLTGVIKVVAFDATEVSIQDLRDGINDVVIAQKPWLMGQLGVDFAVSYLEGQTDLPTNVATGFGIITRDNVDKPEIQALIY